MLYPEKGEVFGTGEFSGFRPAGEVGPRQTTGKIGLAQPRNLRAEEIGVEPANMTGGHHSMSGPSGLLRLGLDSCSYASIRAIFELTYDAWDAHGMQVQQPV